MFARENHMKYGGKDKVLILNFVSNLRAGSPIAQFVVLFYAISAAQLSHLVSRRSKLASVILTSVSFVLTWYHFGSLFYQSFNSFSFGKISENNCTISYILA